MNIDILTDIRYLLCNVVTNYIMFLFFKMVYKPKLDRPWVYFLLYIAVVAVRTAVACIGIPPLNMIVSLVCIQLVSIMFYKCKIKECFLPNLAFISIGLFADMVGKSLVSAFTGHTIEEVLASYLLSYIGSLINCILQILFSRWLIYFFNKEERTVIRAKEILFLTVMTVLEILFIVYATNNVLSDISGVYLVLLSCGFLFINVYVMHLIEQVAHVAKLQRDLSLSNQQMSLQLKYYSELKEKQEVSRKVVHDVKKHLQTVDGLYSSGCMSEAVNYSLLLQDELDKLQWGFTHNNKILETIIGSKLEQAKLVGIKFTVDLEDINLDFVEDLDITAIFANLLDNSFEACLELKPELRFINLTMYKHKNFIMINVSNNYVLIKSNGKLFNTTKKNHSGIGLSNISSAVNKYGGNFLATVENEKFVVKIIIPIK